MSNADPNENSRWTERQAAWAWERPARAAVLLAVLSSLGAMLAWSLMLVDGGDPRTSVAFWLMAAGLGCWMAPVRAYARWTMRTLWLALLLWPLLALAAVLALLLAPAGRFAEWATPTWLLASCGGSAILSAAGLVCLRRSSLPGGVRAAECHGKDDRPADALPTMDGALVYAQKLLLFPIILVILMMSGAFAALTPTSPEEAFATSINHDMAIFGVFLAVFLGLFSWGQYQARRNARRLPIGLLAAAILLGATALALTTAMFAEGAAEENANLAVGGGIMAVVALAVIVAEITACQRLAKRSRFYRPGTMEPPRRAERRPPV